MHVCSSRMSAAAHSICIAQRCSDLREAPSDCSIECENSQLDSRCIGRPQITFDAVGRAVAIVVSQVLHKKLHEGCIEWRLCMQLSSPMSPVPQDSLQLMPLLLPASQE